MKKTIIKLFSIIIVTSWLGWYFAARMEWLFGSASESYSGFIIGLVTYTQIVVIICTALVLSKLSRLIKLLSPEEVPGDKKG